MSLVKPTYPAEKFTCDESLKKEADRDEAYKKDDSSPSAYRVEKSPRRSIQSDWQKIARGMKKESRIIERGNFFFMSLKSYLENSEIKSSSPP